MPKNPITHIQKSAPGPPPAMARATPPMLPSPTVAERAAERAWKWVMAPGSSGRSYLPRVTATPWVSALNWTNLVQTVKRIPAPMRTKNVHGPHMKLPIEPTKSMTCSMVRPCSPEEPAESESAGYPSPLPEKSAKKPTALSSTVSTATGTTKRRSMTQPQ